MERVSIQRIIQMSRSEFSKSKHFFESQTMRFFHTTLPKYGWQGGNGIFFITGERIKNNPFYPRAYTIRNMHILTRRIETIGNFMEYETRKEAKRKIMKDLIH